jgi:hypothetical protein
VLVLWFVVEGVRVLPDGVGGVGAIGFTSR